MVSMMNITLNQLEGIWLTNDGNSSLWIGGTDQDRIEICVNREPVVSEHTHFEYDTERNICKISDSVLLWQIFDDDTILVRIQNDNADLIVRRRK